ncbi:MAG: HAMP domain-containing sensor histidine kinase, partial [Candidatus Nitrotoga sp.]
MSQWPQGLKTAVEIMLGSRYAMWIGWGPEFIFLYNDAYAAMTLGPKHPWALGQPASEVWSEIWHDIGPRAESVLQTGEATWDEKLLLFLERRNFPEETYHTFSYSALPDGDGIGGMLCVVTEDTERVIGERRLQTLRELAARTTDEARTVNEACQNAVQILQSNPQDLPFTLIYLVGSNGETASLAGLNQMGINNQIVPELVKIAEKNGFWPFADVMEQGHSVEVENLRAHFGDNHVGVWPENPQQAMILPLTIPGQTQLAGFLVTAVSPRLVFNDAYKGFFELLAGQIASAVANAKIYEDEKKRAKELAELDKAKTAFFSNVSHEFRTPLTLMLGPVEDFLTKYGTELPNPIKDSLEIVNRNGVRLLRLVNTLLDFSRIEAGRSHAAFQPTDLAELTTDLASVFRAAMERGGLELITDCQELAEPVYVDREMWEKIVLNLLSNALKFTFEGKVTVSQIQKRSSIELTVRDTGTGIPNDQLHHLFDRFHRIENALSRTHEGSGIGLTLVQELVKLHGGSIKAESEPGVGSAFTVSIPSGKHHLPADQIVEGTEIHFSKNSAITY